MRTGEMWVLATVTALLVVVGLLALACWRSNRVRRRFYRYYSPALSTAAISILGAATIALVSLVLEDWFPAPEESDKAGRTWVWEAQPVTNGMRVVVAVAMLMLLIVAITARSRREHGTGTLYHVRLLPEGVRDFHREAVRRAEADHMDYRRATEAFDIAKGERIIDVRRQVERISVELERAANDDRSDSGSRYAPNILAPASVGLGYGWSPERGAVLVDMNRREGRLELHDFEFPLERKPRWRYLLRAKWEKILHGDSTTYNPCTPGRMADPRENMGVHLEIVKEFGPGRRLPPDSVKIAHLCINVSDQVRNVKQELGSQATQVVGFGRNGQLAPAKVVEDGQVMFAHIDPGGGRPLVADSGAGISLQRVCEESALHIRRIISEYPEAAIVLQIQAPKTVTFGIGWYLANAPLSSTHSAARYPWQRLVPVAFAENRLVPMRVRWDQVDPAGVSGLELSP
ncbi:hypothetical protein [Gordonia sp. (in: high G+C Gram-positive bacteria)]|uniref:hypothetical protein n=1 Tax=Gordonia sp. (in: high G+C Gram-positive bacteria) TaxID=84139 RepID=UPI00199596DF|nr:hypothetical protein [Gordonia sp. (in: high G+C Gram-positive bacteria)]MBD0022823.1 hypothetical protein [Gordonia sp. (in: high G+C Gram-positive bacteria)]